MTISFLIDAQLPTGLARNLQLRGFSAEHVNEIGLGVADDKKIWTYAQRTGATLITKDQDFVSFCRREPTGPSVVLIRLGNIANLPLWRAINPILDEIVEALTGGEKVVEVR